ncbi:phosphohydrolase, partial [Acinetobacter baumannii]
KMTDADTLERARFTAMDNGTQEDWAIIGKDYLQFAAKVPDRVLAHLRLLDGDFGGFPIDRLQHSLQTATRAHRDGRPESYVIMALLHDVGDT